MKSGAKSPIAGEESKIEENIIKIVVVELNKYYSTPRIILINKTISKILTIESLFISAF